MGLGKRAVIEVMKVKRDFRLDSSRLGWSIHYLAGSSKKPFKGRRGSIDIEVSYSPAQRPNQGESGIESHSTIMKYNRHS
ncbi:MAG: hypothetical protein ACUVV4_01025 [Candidatus Bathyarchaeia archaeon]